MIPDVRVFLDVDHTATGSEASSNEQVDTSNTTLVFCTKRFFDSGPCLQARALAAILTCLQELIRAICHHCLLAGAHPCCAPAQAAHRCA